MSELRRILIAHSGCLGRQLVQYYRSVHIESVLAFSEPDAEREILDESDFAVYLLGKSQHETYDNADRVLAAAVDSGCDAVHCGGGPLSFDAAFVTAAINLSVAVVGCDADQLMALTDVRLLRPKVRALGLKAFPFALLRDESERVLAMHTLGEELVVWENNQWSPLVEPIVYGEEPLLVQPEMGWLQKQVVVVKDRLSSCFVVCQVRVVDSVVVFEPEMELAKASQKLIAATKFAGVCVVHWVISTEGNAFVKSVTPALPLFIAAVEPLCGVDLIAAQHDALLGRPVISAPGRCEDGIFLQVQITGPIVGPTIEEEAWCAALEPGQQWIEGQNRCLGEIWASGKDAPKQVRNFLKKNLDNSNCSSKELRKVLQAFEGSGEVG